ncbi:hypothetical protein [Pseudoalteromonas tunicata]|jgi:hypothetical protein|uniref:Uncharacterized protein n=1 Tax=Pseudoalteromonas tunicata D2 TaxID=87626 RepID=A4CDJ3_9GAMM|nr:hypothetical protein [Pseudoalteromonas tunicata]ATC96474.1 hypothetical protein PTUN_a4282 [Pseudoalteromonas tunicata]EAR27035.1 hypothetical protein PTD2_05175 [Pseudoalteromonas tunicata D2]
MRCLYNIIAARKHRFATLLKRAWHQYRLIWQWMESKKALIEVTPNSWTIQLLRVFLFK